VFGQRLVLLIAACVFLARPCLAGEDGSQALPKEIFGTAVLRALYVTTPLVQAADGWSTLKVIQNGGRELNPVMDVASSNRAVFIAAKAGITIAEIYGTSALARRHKFVAIGVLAGINTAYAVFAAHNFNNANQR
jgi:hypothetical protein